MIKRFNDEFYITLGELCYVLSVKDGELSRLWFGDRIEPEDDLLALGAASEREFYVASLDGAKKSDSPASKGNSIDFRFKSFEIADKAEFSLPSSRGGETLKICLEDGEGLCAELYYTPFSRGGIARHMAIENRGKTAVTLRAGCAFEFDGETIAADALDNCATVRRESDCFMFAALYCAKTLRSLQKRGGAEVRFEPDEDITLGAGERYESPEFIAVHSTQNAAQTAASRVFHDIIRENVLPEKFARRPVSLYCPDEKCCEDIESVNELGVDCLVVPFSDSSDTSKLNELSAACKTAGLMFGICFDKPRPADYDYICAAIEKTGADYVSLKNLPACRNRTQATSRYELLSRIAAAHGDLFIECPPDLGSLTYCPVCAGDGKKRIAPLSDLLPPVSVTTTAEINGMAKRAFDVASIGCLTYALDPATLSRDVRRAIRAQAFMYKDDADVICRGDLYKGKNITIAVSKDKSKAYAVVRGGEAVRFCGLDTHGLYYIRELGKTFSGAALKAVGLTSSYLENGETMVLHLRAVADYE